MEHEEKEDSTLLIQGTGNESGSESSGKENDCYLEAKIREFIQCEKQARKSKRKTFIFIFACFLTFLSCCILIVTFPIYVQFSTKSGIKTYGKLAVLSSANAILFTIVHFLLNIVAVCSKRSISGFRFHLCLPKVLKICISMSAGSTVMFWLIDGQYVSCHLQDPLKGCALVFSLLFYFFISHRKMSLERMFCTITVIIGVFLTVDYGICDRFRCYGNDYTTQTLPHGGSAAVHFLCLVLYVVAHGMWVLPFTYLENTCFIFHGSTSEMSVVTRTPNSPQDKPSGSGLAFVCQDDASVLRHYQSFYTSNICTLNTTVPPTSQDHTSLVRPGADFPLTSTPNESLVSWQPWLHWRSYSVLLWGHWVWLLLIVSLCWVPTLHFMSSGKENKLLIEVVEEAWFSLTCHTGHASTPICDRLMMSSAILLGSYVTLMLGAMLVLSYARSAITVMCILMHALPISGLWWSLWRIDFDSLDILVFQPEVTGEAVCAMLGFPVMGIGTFLLVKSHIREFDLL